MALMPKRTKHRKMMKGQVAGLSKGGNLFTLESSAYKF